MAEEHMVENVALADLRPHPNNYREHPEDQVNHIIESIKEHGFYRNVVVAKDGTVLAGHGVVQAALRMGLEMIPVVRLDIEPLSPQALKILVGDNEISHLGMRDDRALAEMLREIKVSEGGHLLGTGFDDMMLANLVFVTRPASEISDFDAAAHWVGMPEYDEGEERLKLIVQFRSGRDRERFGKLLGFSLTDKTKSVWWPPKNSQDDLISLRFEEK